MYGVYLCRLTFLVVVRSLPIEAGENGWTKSQESSVLLQIQHHIWLTA